MQYFVERTPGAFIRLSEGSISFEYQDCDPNYGEDQARVLIETLEKGPLSNTMTEVVHSSKMVHVRLAGVRKVDMVQRVLNEFELTHGVLPDFVFVAGDLLKDDEALFQTLNNSTTESARELIEKRMTLSVRSSPRRSFDVGAKHFPEPHTYEETLLPQTSKVYTCCIPGKASHAQRYMDSPDELSSFLIKLADTIPMETEYEAVKKTNDAGVFGFLNHSDGLSTDQVNHSRKSHHKDTDSKLSSSSEDIELSSSNGEQFNLEIASPLQLSSTQKCQRFLFCKGTSLLGPLVS